MKAIFTAMVLLLLILSAHAEQDADKVNVKAGFTVPESMLGYGEIMAMPSEMEKPSKLEFTVETYPVTDGSTSAEPLGVWVASRFLRRDVFWGKAPDGERRLLPMRTFSQPDGEGLSGDRAGRQSSFIEHEAGWKLLIPFPGRFDSELYGNIRHSGTHTAYKNLILGESDLIYECRLPSEDEKALMAKHGVELEAVPIALDAFVFLRHKDNPVTGLTSEQVRNIYARGEENAGIINNWKQVGGPDENINAYIRNPNSGSQETLKNIVMEGLSIIEGRGITGMSMAGPYNLLYTDRRGIGFTFFYYQSFMAPLSVDLGLFRTAIKDEEEESTVEMFQIDGVIPSRESIASGSYPWITEVYAITRRDIDPEHPAAKLRNWLLSAEGQAVIGETGYIPLK